ncbi:MAG TPA: VOC family protein [Candidatus Limnocylindria bacterium]|nr:VOC family protein [Candidatus Limnocylindria bacterium]
MKVRGIRWLGTPTDRYAETVAFARDILGLTLRLEQEDFAVFAAENGDTFEVFGPKAIADGHQFMVAPVAGFAVDDVAAARRELEAKGIRFIGDVHTGASSAWSHFYGPDGHVYEITAGP